jgi:hypothetical protein
MTDVYIELSWSGLGDRLLDVLGFYVICKCLDYNPKVIFNNSQHWFVWGISNYDLRLFEFNHIELIENKSCEYYIHSPNPSSSLSPYKAFEFVSKKLPNMTFERFSDYYYEYAKEIIRPSSIILSKLPEGLENSYGIHLRKSDKITAYGRDLDLRHENTMNEFDVITQILLEDVKKIIISEDSPRFLIVSEDNGWKNEFQDKVNQIATENNRVVHMINIDYGIDDFYVNYNGILDMFCLSRCKEILQGVKYSTFSILASLLGNNKLRNYSEWLPTYDSCLIHSWNSAVEINGKKNFDIELHKKITESVSNLRTNIL